MQYVFDERSSEFLEKPSETSPIPFPMLFLELPEQLIDSKLRLMGHTKEWNTDSGPNNSPDDGESID